MDPASLPYGARLGLIVGTAGHIDHGKTSLVRALTGIDTDRLPEEKARGITLDLGFAYQQLENGGVLGFVDVPGHERLVHTMIAGASSIGMALLVVAADDGVMPQTREHLQILSLLGLSRGIVALSKIDLVDRARASEVESHVLALLDGTPLAGAACVPVSSVTGAGLSELRARLLAEAARAGGPNAAIERAFRLSVDRSFSLAGAGTVVTGSIVAGKVRRGDSQWLLPSGMRARVRAVHVANQAVEEAVAGERCALNLIGPGVRKDAISRGDWIVAPGQDSTSRRCDAVVHFPRGVRSALKSGTPILLHHGAAQVTARVVPLGRSSLPPGAGGLVHLVLDRSLPLRHGDRLVFRDSAASRTLGGGKVLDPRPPDRRRHHPERLAALQTMTATDPLEALRGFLSHPPYLARRATILEDWGLSGSGLNALVQDVLPLGDFIATRDAINRLGREVASALAEFHTREPTAPGMKPEALRFALPTRLPPDAFAAILSHLCAAGSVAVDGVLLRAPAQGGGLAEGEVRLWGRLQPVLDAEPFRPPLLRDAADRVGIDQVALRRACKAFARLGLVVELAPDRFFLMSAAVQMAEAAHVLAAEAGGDGFSAAQFRDRLGNGRQLATQVLESFDRRGITVRRGDRRSAGKAMEAEPGIAASGHPGAAEVIPKDRCSI